MQTPEVTPDKLDQALSFLVDTMKETKDFALDQAPIVVREIVAWQLWSNIISATATAATAAFLLLYMRKRAHEMPPTTYEDFPTREFGIVLSWGGAITLAICSLIDATAAAKALVAPRLVVLEFLQNVIK